MKITLDHNCLINIENETENGKILREKIEKGEHEFFIADVGASEILQGGFSPEQYDLFEKFLANIGLGHLPRLTPIMVYDVTFWDKGLWAGGFLGDLYDSIEHVLFRGEVAKQKILDRKKTNRICDILTIWCHIYYSNDIFITDDGNFHKEEKKKKLIELGANKIGKPVDMD